MIEPYYQDSLTTLYCGRCEDVLPIFSELPFDLLLTDPPYGVKRDKGFEGFEGFGGCGAPIARRRYESDNWDGERINIEIMLNLLRLSTRAIIFGGNFYTDILPVGNHWIVWDKKNTMPSFGDCELIWTNFDRSSIKK